MPRNPNSPEREGSSGASGWILACVMVLAVATGALLPGCGGSSTPAPPPAREGQTSVAPAVGGQPGGRAPVGARPIVRVIDGKKWIGDVPRDIYFEDPLSVAADRRQIGTQTVAGGPMTDQADPNGSGKTPAGGSKTDDPPSAASAGDWKSVIGIEPLKSEIKTIRNTLNGHLQNVGKFNSGLKDIPAHGATLAVLAGVASAHSEDVSWKKNAKFVRDLAGQMFAEDLARGRKSFDQVKTPFEAIIEILDGGTPAELPESQDETTFSDVADFGHLMQRIDRGFKWIQGNARDEESYKANADRVRHEAAVLGVLAKVIKEEGYGWSDDEDYVKHADTMLNACQTIDKAVAAEKFADYDKAVSTIDQLCTQCHMGRR